MEIRRINKLVVNSTSMGVKWNKNKSGASFSYLKKEINIGLGIENQYDDLELLSLIVHELWEICCEEFRVRHRRIDCDSEYIFVYDHRQFTTISEMFSGLLKQFIK